MDELSDADGGRISVAAHANANQLAIRKQGTGGHRRHASMYRVKAMRAAQEICRGLGRAPDAAGFDDELGLNAHFIHRLDDAL